MFGFFKREEKKQMSKFEQHCTRYNKFYASMYQDFCFDADIPSYEDLDASNPFDIDLAEALEDMESILEMRIGSVKISDSITIICEHGNNFKYSYISMQIGGKPILTQTWMGEKEYSRLESASVLHEKYLGHVKYICNYIHSKAEQKKREKKIKEEEDIERAIHGCLCKESKND